MKKLSARYSTVKIAAILVVVTFILATLISYTQPFQTLDLKIRDQLFELRGPLDISNSPIVLVAISEQADSEIPQKFPWPTDVYARLINNLNRAGAKAIGIDVIFNKPDSYDHSNDTTFAKMLAKHKNVILAGNLLKEKSSITSSGNLQELNGGGGQSTQISKEFPLSLLQRSNPNPVGLAGLVTDADGFIREYMLTQKFMDDYYHSFGLEVIREYKDISSAEIQHTPDKMHLGDFQIPKTPDNTMIINYYGGPKTFPIYSFDQIIDDSTYNTVMEEPDFQINAFDDPEYGLLHEDIFEDKIVLVGSTMPTLHDLHPTPFVNGFYETGSMQMPGFEIHAHAIQTILDGNFYSELSSTYTLALIFLFSLTAIIGAIYSGAFSGLLFILLQVLGFCLFVFYAFTDFHLILDVTGVILASVMGYTGTLALNYLIEQREKSRIKNMFASYVSPELVEELVESGRDPQLGGDTVHITAFFSDIESFSTFSEKLDAKQLVKLMNEYLNAMTTIITNRSGTLDKYIGDAIVAFFGAPVYVQNHAYEACVASQLMQYKQEELQERWKKKGDKWPQIVHHMRTRIGINTGPMVTGNMGSTHRFNYTMMGDNVNLAARCESGAKSYGVYTMVTEQTKKEAQNTGDKCVFRYLDRIVVKGKTEPVKMYEIVGLRDRLITSDFECIRLFEKAQQYYLNQRFDQAIKLFRKSKELEPIQRKVQDNNPNSPSNVFIKRCQKLRNDPPPKDWNGVFVMKTK